MKEKQIFVCTECGTEYYKWQGKCDICGNWNTIVERIITTSSKNKVSSLRSPGKLLKLVSSGIKPPERINTGFSELDRVLGGGVVPGSTILIGGPPGIGKSTLLMQVVSSMASNGQRVIYLSGEESPEQIMLRAARIGAISDNLFILTETDITQLISEIEQEEYSVVVIDSVQSVYLPELETAAGSYSQIKEITRVISELAKSKNISVFLVGHITKEGAIAGPKFLEHMVDVVLYFEEETDGEYRLIRVFK
ncbi:MAG: AAA family ATPase, partial [bacterium]